MIYTKIETSGKEELSGWEWHPFEAKGSRGGDPGSDRYGKAYAPYKEIQNPKHKTEKHKEIYAGVQDLSSGGNYATAWMSLFMQSPFGELPTGFRSSHHIWNEAEQCVIFEIYASEYAKLGYTKEAGAFKRAAMLSLGSISQWIREDGSGYIVKNRYPKEARHGYEKYSVLPAIICWHVRCWHRPGKMWMVPGVLWPNKKQNLKK